MTKRLIWLRYISWIIIGILFVYILIEGSLSPTRASLILQSEGELEYRNIGWDNLGDLLVCSVLFVIGTVLFIIEMKMKQWLPHNIVQSLLSLSQFVYCSYLWVLTDSYLLSYFTNNVALVALLSYITFTVMFAFLFEFIMCISKTNKYLVLICECLYALEAILLIDYLFGFLHKQILVVFVYILFTIASLIILYQTIYLMKKEKLLIGKYIINGYICLAISGLGALIVYVFNINIDYTIFYTIGIILMCYFLTLGTTDRMAMFIEEHSHQQAYKKLAYTDEMTGLKNKTAYLEKEKEPLQDNSILIMLDLNDLKSINDTYGHRVGDEVLIVASKTLKKFFRREDCYRFGGDGFCVLLNEMSYEKVQQRLDEMRAYMDEHNKNSDIKIEFSIGTAKQHPGDTLNSLFLRADKAMYQDKYKTQPKHTTTLKPTNQQLSIWDTQEMEIPKIQ